MSVTNNTTLSANLTVDGNTTLGNASSDTVTIPGFLDVNGYAEFDNIRINGNTISAQNADGSVTINGNGSGKINLNDDTDITGSLTVDGGAIFNGGVVLGNQTSDTITATGTFNSDLVPSGATQDLGTSTQEWRNLFITGTAHVDTLDVDGNAGVIGSLTVTALLDANGGAHIDNLRLGVDADNDITTSSGNLTLDSAGGTVQVNDNLTVDGTISGNGSGLNTLNANNLNSGTVPIGRLGDSGTKNGTTFLAGDNTFKQVVVAINNLTNAGNNRVITSSGGSDANSESNLTFDGSTLGVSGAITCSGDITALTSDIRLKTGIQPIENAVAKILKLNGFTYNHNEIAGKLGLDTDIRYSGVSAQDVKEVLPEAVKPAPINEEYMTVQYEKLVPLLIEAIKELKSEIDELKK